MTNSPRPQTTRSSQKTGGLFRSGKQHPKWLGSKKLELVGQTFGSVTIVSSRLHRVNGSVYVKAKCALTGITKLTSLNNLLRKKTTSFLKNGRRPTPHAEVLGRRYDAILARCTDPRSKGWANYGARGIKLMFKSRMEFIQWVTINLPHQDYKGVEIDRINNNGHYQPGNLRLATRLEQNRNKRNTPKLLWGGRQIPIHEFPSPYSRSWTDKLIRQGLTGEQILARRGSTT